MRMRGVLRAAKYSVMKPGRRSWRIKAGPFRKMRMMLDAAGQGQVILGFYERETFKDLRRLSKDINTAVDVGSAQGEYALYFLMRTQACRVYAFEPLEGERELLRANLSLNGLENSERLTISDRFVGSNVSDSQVTLDSLIAEIAPPCLVKIDVDGPEVEILEGSAELLALDGVSWLIETHSHSLESSCVRILSSAGYSTKVIDHAWWRPVIPDLRPPDNRWLAASRR